MGVATYYYNNENCGTNSPPPQSPPLKRGGGGECAPRLGLIAEEAPKEVLSANGKGVDVYKLATFILAGVQEQQVRIEKLELRITKLEQLVASSTGSTSDPSLRLNLLDYLAALGAKFTNGLAELKSLVVESLTVGKSEKPSGITLYDEVTKQPYCLSIANGQPVSRAGVCGGQTSTPQSGGLTSTASDADTTPPVITVLGNNPAEIVKGTVYADLGASVTDNVNSNLGYQTLGLTDINTSAAATYIITYTATDGAGNTATTTRTVIVTDGSSSVQVQPQIGGEVEPVETSETPTPATAEEPTVPAEDTPTSPSSSSSASSEGVSASGGEATADEETSAEQSTPTEEAVPEEEAETPTEEPEAETPAESAPAPEQI